MQDQLTRLCVLATRHARGPSLQTAIPRVSIGLRPEVSVPVASLYRPMLCLILQGAKEVTIGDQRLRYDPSSYFIASLDLPACGRVIQASRDQPYIGLSLMLDRDLLAALAPEVAPRSDTLSAGFAVSPVTPALLDAWLRLLGLLDTPQDVAFMAPLLEREILYRLLQGPQGGVLRQIAVADSRLSRVRAAIAWIREHYDEPLRVADLAALAAMSPATFHRQFKAATALSPLQYQKSLRLQHARRLLVAEADVSRASFAVGYESASQFSREYARLFGASPARDALRLRADSGALAEAAGAV